MNDDYGNDVDIDGKIEIVKKSKIDSIKSLCTIIEATAIWDNYESFHLEEEIITVILDKYKNDR